MAVKKSKVNETTVSQAPTQGAATKKAVVTKPAAIVAPTPAPAPVIASKVKATAKTKPEAATPAAPAAKGKKASPAVATVTASKAETPKPASAAKMVVAVAAATKVVPVPAKKAPAAIKLTGRQVEFLKQIQDAKDLGYLQAKKAEQKTIDALLDRKLIKKGAKDKTSGHYRYMVSKAGEKHLEALPPASA